MSQSPPSEHDQLAHLVEVEIPKLEAELADAREEVRYYKWLAEFNRRGVPARDNLIKKLRERTT